VEGDERGWRVALIASALVNPATGALDGLAVLEREGWGAIALPDDVYPPPVSGPLLEQVAEQAEEFARHGYVLAIVGGREGLVEALAHAGVGPLPTFGPADEDELASFLRRTAAAGAPRS